MKNWKIAGINFDHFHMGDLLRMAHEHSVGRDRRHLRRAARADGRCGRATSTSLPSEFSPTTALAWSEPSRISSSSARPRPSTASGPSGLRPLACISSSKSPSPRRSAEADRMIAAMRADRQAIGDQLAAAVGASRTRPPSGSSTRALIGELIEYPPLRRQPRPAVAHRRQNRAHGRSSAPRKTAKLVLQARARRRVAARLRRLRLNARHVVHGRPQAARGHRARRSAARAGGR